MKIDKWKKMKSMYACGCEAPYWFKSNLFKSISLAAAPLEVAKPPCEPASLLTLTFPCSFSCYIEHTSEISSFPLNLSISLHRKKNLFVGTKDSIHPLEGVAGYGCLRPECGPVGHCWLGRGVARRITSQRTGGITWLSQSNCPINRWESSQQVKLDSDTDFPKEKLFQSKFSHANNWCQLILVGQPTNLFHNCCICCFNKLSLNFCTTTDLTHTYSQNSLNSKGSVRLSREKEMPSVVIGNCFLQSWTENPTSQR